MLSVFKIQPFKIGFANAILSLSSVKLQFQITQNLKNKEFITYESSLSIFVVILFNSLLPKIISDIILALIYLSSY